MVQICSPLPDELAKSHLIRFQRINAIATPNQALKELSSRARQDSRHEAVPARRLALAVGVCPDQYIRRHTFLTYWMSRRAPDHVPSRMADVGEDSAWRNRDGLLSLAVPAPVLSFCLQCAAQDIERFGFSYWRRGHQLAGATYCSRHQVHLTFTPYGAPKTSSLPHEHQHVTTQDDLRLTAAQRDAVNRYQALGEALAARSSPICPTSTSFGHWIRSRLDPVDRGAVAEAVYRLCLATFGAIWLQQRWSANTKQKCLKSISQRLQGAIDWMVCPASTEVFTLIATALTTTTTDAVAIMEGSRTSVDSGFPWLIEAPS